MIRKKPSIKPAVKLDAEGTRLFDKVAEDVLHNSRHLLDKLSEHEKRTVIQWMSDAIVDGNPDNSIHDLLWEIDFVRKPVPIEKFLMDDYYFGRSCSELHDKWVNDLVQVFRVNSPVIEYILTGGIGIGKGLRNCDPVLTPIGWRRNGDLKVGDQVIGSCGHPTEVTGVFPRGRIPTFKVVFDDGASVTVDGDHLWSVRSPTEHARSAAWRTVATRDLVGAVCNGRGQKRWHIPVLSAPVVYASATVPMSAYALGALLGDGRLTADKSNPIIDGLRDLDCRNHPYDKRIPLCYLQASVEDRTNLLRGLMDTDGWVQNSGRATCISTSSSGLADDIVELVRSLGGIAYRSRKEAPHRDAHVLCLSVPFNPFQVAHKAQAWKPDTKYRTRRMIASITASEPAEVTCIQVAAADQLYVVKDFIVTHNTTIACAGIGYKTYYLSCLRNPASYYGLLPDSLLVLGIYSITKKQVNDSGYFKLKSFIDSSPYFRNDFRRNYKIDSKIDFTNQQNMQILTGSTNLHAIGLDLFSFLMDEVNFMRAKMDADTGKMAGQAYELYNSTNKRLLSRFLRPGGTIPGLMMLLSSRNSQTSFLEERLKITRGLPTTYVSDYALWDVKSPHLFTLPKFNVEVGDRVARSRLLKDGEKPRKDSNTILIPGELKQYFIEDIDQALRDFAGVATFNLSPLIRDRQSVFDSFKANFKHPFKRDVFSIDIHDDTLIEEYFDIKTLCRIEGSKWVPRLNPGSPRFIHTDIALSGDALGLAMSHLAGMKRIKRYNPETGITSVLEAPYVVVDLMIRILPPVGSEIDLSKVRAFILFLSKIFTVPVASFDGFQSADSRQILEKAGFETPRVSVDISDEAYLLLRSTLFERRLATYAYAPFEQEMLDLQRQTDRRKVDHPERGSNGEKGRKDVADAVCGSVYTAMTHAKSLNNARSIILEDSSPQEHAGLIPPPLVDAPVAGQLPIPAGPTTATSPVELRVQTAKDPMRSNWASLRKNLKP